MNQRFPLPTVTHTFTHSHIHTLIHSKYSPPPQSIPGLQQPQKWPLGGSRGCRTGRWGEPSLGGGGKAWGRDLAPRVGGASAIPSVPRLVLLSLRVSYVAFFNTRSHMVLTFSVPLIPGSHISGVAIWAVTPPTVPCWHTPGTGDCGSPQFWPAGLVWWPWEGRTGSG